MLLFISVGSAIPLVVALPVAERRPATATGLIGSGIPTIFGNFDLAAVFGDMLNATASGGNFLTDIVP
jgi:hypothetical protein